MKLRTVYSYCLTTLVITIAYFFFSSLVSSQANAMSVAATEQENYRFRNDDGSQAAATWKAANNTAITGVVAGASGDTVRLRFSIKEVNGVSVSVAPQLEFSTNAGCTTGSWTAVDNSSTDWRLVTSTHFADGDTTTNQIGTGTFTAGRMSESSNPTASISLLSQVTEVEYAIRGVNASTSTAYYFRITNNGTTLSTYTNCAQLTTAAPPTPTQIVFTNAARTLTAGVCNGAASVFTMQVQDGSNNPLAPTGSTVIRVTSNSSNYTIYSDSSCTNQVTNGDFTFTTSDTTMSVYIIDTKKSISTRTLTGTKQSGPDTLSTGNQNYTVNAGSVTKLVVTLPGQTFTDGTGNSNSPTNRTAGSSFTITSLSETDVV